MYLGDDLSEVLRSVMYNETYEKKDAPIMETNADVLPNFVKDTSDRNRTSPFAFTGNKFEFRMVGSSENIACTNTIINTIVADVLSDFADILEKAEDDIQISQDDILVGDGSGNVRPVVAHFYHVPDALPVASGKVRK